MLLSWSGRSDLAYPPSDPTDLGGALTVSKALDVDTALIPCYWSRILGSTRRKTPQPDVLNRFTDL